MKPLKILVAVAAVTCFAFVPKEEVRKISIVLDAGHGGKDFGATHDDFTEKEITSQFIGKIHALNQNENIDIQFTRISDDHISLEQRAALINRVNPDLVLSLHVNKNQNVTASGVDIFTPKTESPNNLKSTAIAQKLSDKLEKNLNMKIRGIKMAPFYILNKTTAPALVVELGFISNSTDRAYLTDDTSQTRIANTLLEFISELE